MYSKACIYSNVHLKESCWCVLQTMWPKSWYEQKTANVSNLISSRPLSAETTKVQCKHLRPWCHDQEKGKHKIPALLFVWPPVRLKCRLEVLLHKINNLHRVFNMREDLHCLTNGLLGLIALLLNDTLHADRALHGPCGDKLHPREITASPGE